ncbi:UNVERIFIED_CONTAM: hypothetical protein HDU68_002273 [Siphonaria sp. JEL0065]|nr:hypothetical protein HDU68_002273 [Siphonaria sp. JEL0065]
MNVEIPASLYALLQQQQQLAASHQHLNRPPLHPSVAASKPAPPNPSVLSSSDSSSKARSVFVDRLVDTAASIIESIWPTQIPHGTAKVLPLKVFIQEILRRSKTSFSTLQLALFYIVRLRNQLSKDAQSDVAATQPEFSLLTPPASPTMLGQKEGLPICGRRMFLTALILASKYLQDRNYSNKAWSKISGLTVLEINANEFKFLSLIDYELFVGHETFANWTTLLMAKTQQLQLAQQQQFLQQQQQGKASTTLLQQTSSLDASCNPCDTYAQQSSLQSLAFVATAAQKYLSASPVSVSGVSPSLGDYPSPSSADDSVPQGSDCGLKRGRSFVDEDDSFVKRVCL